MASDLAASYGRAIVEIARAEGAADRVADELLQFARAVDGNAELRDKLTDESIALEARSAAASDLLQRAHPATGTAVQMLLAANRVRHIADIANAAVTQSAEQRGASVAYVKTAHRLSESQKASLSQALAAKAGRPVEIKESVDPSLIGGITVQLGDMVTDGSVAKRMTELKASLTGA